MCVVAGYVGKRPAAEVLIRMLEIEQGMGGGYYTGIATVHQGRLHSAKTLGDLDILLSQTAAAQLPGTVGIAHSRSKSGGESQWSHPFLADGGRLAYLANGTQGIFKGSTEFGAAGNAALRRGEVLASAADEPIGEYPVLADGTCVHMSEIMAHQIAHRFRQTDDLPAAMELAFGDLPSEIVGLCLHQERPDCFAACRINFPLVAGRDDTGMYAASTALAFPDSVSWATPIPPNSTACLCRDGVELRPLARPFARVAPMPSTMQLERTVVAAVQTGEPQTLGDLCRTTTDLWPQGALDQKTMAVFETLAALSHEGALTVQEVRVPGQYDRGTAPLAQFCWAQ